jgi:hypothetical protein
VKPYLFLDVDGVLNCYPNNDFDIVRSRTNGLVALVPPGMKDRLQRVLPLFEPVWATAWQGSAHMHFREHLALPDESWPYLKYSDLKLTALMKYAGGRRWAWVDDDADWELKRLHPAFGKPSPDSKIIVPTMKVGFTDMQADELIQWAQPEREVQRDR